MFTFKDPVSWDMFGGKAKNLAFLYKAGVQVPKGLVVFPTDGTSNLHLMINKTLGRPKFVAVRSSAMGEDGEASSFAGQFETVLNVDAQDTWALYDAVKVCRDSIKTAQVYADVKGESVGEMAVLIQPMLKPTYAGVLFTADPIGQRRYVSILEWVKGLGDKLVAGEVSPLGSLEVVTASHTVLTGKEPRWMWQRVIQLGQRIEALFNQPMDIEWAYVRGVVWCLQARPLTSLVLSEVTTLSGVTVVKGTASGIAKWMPSGHDKVPGGKRPKFDDGDVLLTQMTDPRMIEEMCAASAIVTKIGGRTCHAAIIARELGKPCLVNVEGELNWLHGRAVTVDADEGVIYTHDD